MGDFSVYLAMNCVHIQEHIGAFGFFLILLSQLEMLELEKDRPATPVPPPEDEPPPLPAAPPPVPNWNTFPGSQAAFCPAGDIQYFDDAEPSQENLRQEEVTSSKPVPLMAAEKDGVHQRTISETSAEKVEVPVQRSDAEKFDMLMKRIHFFGLKPEESEEYQKAMEGNCSGG